MVFLLTQFFEGKLTSLNVIKILLVVLNNTEDFTKCINTTPRASKYIHECPKPMKLTQIKEFKLDGIKCCFITGEPEPVKHTCAVDYKKKN